jgi:hypothetical protein
MKDVGCDDRDISTYELQLNDLLVVEGHADVNEIGSIMVRGNRRMLAPESHSPGSVQ